MTSKSRSSGATSEDVDETLGPGRFGMAEETGTLLNAAINAGVTAGAGIGEAVATYLAAAAAAVRAPERHCGGRTAGHPAHGPRGARHRHHPHAPGASGAALGEGSLRDFRRFVANVAKLEGGVYLNCGSAVILPEVFLKAVALARNRGIALDDMTTVNLDFVRLYRPQTNVVSRPTRDSGPRLLAGRPPRAHDPAAGRSARRD